ncbi:MAG: VOC family protein [Chloroflexota bacterium]
MHVVTEYPNGLFCWVDLNAKDQGVAKAFYRGLFGWDPVDTPMPDGGSYTNFMLNGRPVAGCGQMSEEMIASGMPSAWNSMIKHDDAEAVMARVPEAGGTVLMPAMDVMDQGRFAMFQDPTGAVAGVWQPINHTGAHYVNYPNTLVWNELSTKDPDQAASFYKAVFGWERLDDGNGYNMFSVDGRAQAGMVQMDESAGEMPPVWMPYFMVEDINASTEKATALGATVIMGPIDAGDMGKFVIVQDPQGAVSTIMQFSGPADPPPGAPAPE